MFANETSSVAEKAEAKAAAKLKQSRSRSGNRRPELSLTCSYSFDPTLEERGFGFFNATFVISSGGSQYSGVDENLLNCIHAVGLAGFAGVAGGHEVFTAAQRCYVAAISSTNAALRSPSRAKEDCTLLAVILLGIFETVAGGDRSSLSAYTNHANGSASLLKLRGSEQLVTPMGRRLFGQALSNINLSCLRLGLPLPEHLWALSEEAARYPGADDPIWFFSRSLMPITDFCAGVRQGDTSDPYAILSRAQELDKKIESVCLHFPPGWQYETVHTGEGVDPDIIFHGYFHAYGSFMSMQLWNSMRICRVLLNEVIRRTLMRGISSGSPRFGGPERTQHLATSVDTLFRMQADILASIPQHRGYTARDGAAQRSNLYGSRKSELGTASAPWAQHSNVVFGMEADDSRWNLPLIRLHGGYLLPWPLFVTGAMELTPAPTRKWIVKTLRAIAHEMGLRLALVLADMLEEMSSTSTPIMAAMNR